jgi:branched-chain amino acid transport system permease protein/neutral amino acid transport system permease protein
MSAFAERIASLLAQGRYRLRYLSDFAGGAGFWLALAGVVAWAAVEARDEFAVGLVVGSIFALGALGLTLIYGVLKFGHFAHGDSMMMSAYLAFFLLTGTVFGERADTQVLPWSLNDLPGATEPLLDLSFGYGLLVAMAAAAVLTAVLLIGLDRLIYRPLRRRGSGIVIFSIASLGVALAVRSVMLIFWGPDPRFYTRGFRSAVDLPFDVRVLADQLFIFAAAVALAGAVYVILYRTKLGKAMRAMADNPDLARVAGIDTDRVVVWTWAIGGALVAVAGTMLALQAQLKPELGFTLLLPLFAAAILGGIGSPQGALLGGLFIGIIQESSASLDFLSPGYKFSVAFVVLILILLVRPRGLFGERA